MFSGYHAPLRAFRIELRCTFSLYSPCVSQLTQLAGGGGRKLKLFVRASPQV